MFKIKFVSVVMGAVVLAVSAGSAAVGRCQILDHRDDSAYSAYMGYLSSSDFEGLGSSSVFEMGGHWNFAYFRDVGSGDIDLGLRFDSVQFMDDAGAFDAPNQLISLYVDAEWDFRLRNGIAMRIGVRPGLYTDMGELGGDSFFMPARIAVIQALYPDLSGIAGFELRPSFERALMPIIGVAWAISDRARLEAQLPRSRFSYVFNGRWSAFAALDWNSDSYNLEEPVDMLTLEDYRMYFGVTHQITPDIRATARLGKAVSRTAEYDNGGSADIDKATYLRVMVGGPF